MGKRTLTVYEASVLDWSDTQALLEIEPEDLAVAYLDAQQDLAVLWQLEDRKAYLVACMAVQLLDSP